MNLMASFGEALSALRVNALRSFLTILGIIIGVAAVITMVSVGSGARVEVEKQINSLGTNTLMIFPGSSTSGGRRFGHGTAHPFKESDVVALKAEVDLIVAASGTLRSTAQVVSGNLNWSTGVRGVNTDYLLVRDWNLTSGRNFTEREIKSAGKVVLLGQTVAEELFGASDPVGETVRIKKVPFRIIGILEEKGQTAFGTDQDDIVFVPLSTARNRLIGKSSVVARNVRSIRVKVALGADIEDAEEAIKDVLRKRRRIAPGAEDDFVVRNFAEFLRARNETQNIFAMLLGATASISLIVGGIGIMNIMLVSVTERTREIGLRMAVGARKRDILFQFLVEAVTLCLIGGAIGILLGLGATFLIARLGDWPTLVGADIVLIAVAFSALVGVFFGFYPARKASLLNPIDALRFE